MKPNKWQKTTITWNPCWEWKTNIPVDDLRGCGPHFIRKMTAVSVIDIAETEERTAVLTFEVVRGCIGPTTRRAEILKKLRSLADEKNGLYVKVSCLDPGTEFKISFNLQGSFCEEVISFVSRLFILLGIEDSTKCYISDFKVTSVTMYRQGEAWITFEDHLKLSLNLYIGTELNAEIMPDTNELRYG